MYRLNLKIKWCEMKIDSISNNSTGYPVKLKHKSYTVPESKERGIQESMYSIAKEEKNYGGSFTGINRAAATAISGAGAKIEKEKFIDKILKLCEEHTVIANSIVALMLGALLRPATIWAMSNDENRGNNAYAAGHAISSAVIGFIFSTILMAPLGTAAKKTRNKIEEAAVLGFIDKAPEDLTREQIIKLDDIKERFGVTTTEELKTKLKEKYNVSDLKDIENLKIFKKFKETYKVDSFKDLETSGAFKKVTKVLDMAPDTFIFGILKATLTIALIPPILKYVFGIEKNKSPKPAEKPQVSANVQEMEDINKPNMAKFLGGLK